MIGPITSIGADPAGGSPVLTTVQRGGAGFEQLIERGIDTVNRDVQAAEHGVQLLAVGATDNLPDTMLGIESARTSLALMVQVRDRLVDAYREMLQMQI